MPMEPKIPTRTDVSFTPEKLKAHKDFGQGNKFQVSLKLLAAQHKQTSMCLPVFHN
jgi:hypothetical protein